MKMKILNFSISLAALFAFSALAVPVQRSIESTLQNSSFWGTLADAVVANTAYGNIPAADVDAFHLYGSRADNDDDADGLSNYVEYLLTRVHSVGTFSPTNAFSISSRDCDFYAKIDDSYVGQVFSDTDHIEDWWELMHRPYYSVLAYDFSRDIDSRGWGGWARCRADIAGVATNGIPRPTLTLTVSYNGAQPIPIGSSLIVHAYALQGARTGGRHFSRANGVADASVIVPDAEFTTLVQGDVVRSPVAFYLSDPSAGWLREGDNMVVAFADLDGNGKYTAGEPMGTVMGVDVGWAGAVANIELTDTSPVFTRCAFDADTTDRAALYASQDGDYYGLVIGSNTIGRCVRVRVLRTLVNGYGTQYIWDDGDNYETGKLVLDKIINLDRRNYIFEGDIFASGNMDIDWTDLAGDIANQEVVADANEVAYRIVLGNGDISATGTNNLFKTVPVRHFDAASLRPTPVNVSPGAEESVVYGARPTFRWTCKHLNDAGTAMVDADSYTAFKVRILNEIGSRAQWTSEYQFLPKKDQNGVYSFPADVYVGDILRSDVNYQWQVSMYNAKYKDTPLWSEATPFRMAAPTNSTSYGSIDVCVKYFGPASVLSGGTVRVEAFTTPDFTGSPVARTYVTDESSVSATNTEHTANATLVGLAAGTYYVRAYIDLDSYGTKRDKEDTESWGYACPLGSYSPSPVAVNPLSHSKSTIDVYIDDVDTNGNNLPDAWELITSGSLSSPVSLITDTIAPGIPISTNLTSSL